VHRDADISVLIPHAGDRTRIQRCLDSLVCERILEVLIVLPEDARGSVGVIRRYPLARAIITARLTTFAQATNLAAAEARGRYLMLLNDDTAVAAGALDRLAEEFERDTRLGVAAPLLLNPDRSVQYSVCVNPSWRALGELIFHPLFAAGPLTRFARFPYRALPRPLPDDTWVSGAAAMLPRDLFVAIGGLDEAYPHGIEDAAMCTALRSRGCRIVVIPEARIVHEGGVSGFRNTTDSERVANALYRGTLGWVHYWKTHRGASRGSVFRLQVAFALLGLLRLVGLTIALHTAGHERREGHRLRRKAYQLYLHRLFASFSET